MIYLLFPLYGGDGRYNYSYITEEVTVHESLEAAHAYVVEVYGPDMTKLQDEDGDGYPSLALSRWDHASQRRWELILTEYDGFDQELYGFEIIIPADK